MHGLMGPFPFYLLFGKFIYAALRKAHEGLFLQEGIIEEQVGSLLEASWEDFAAIAVPKSP